MSKVGEYYREMGFEVSNSQKDCSQVCSQGCSRAKFTQGFIAALLVIFFVSMLISCSVTTLEASGSGDCGDSSWNPCYVKIVE